MMWRVLHLGHTGSALIGWDNGVVPLARHLSHQLWQASNRPPPNAHSSSEGWPWPSSTLLTGVSPYGKFSVSQAASRRSCPSNMGGKSGMRTNRPEPATTLSLPPSHTTLPWLMVTTTCAQQCTFLEKI